MRCVATVPVWSPCLPPPPNLIMSLGMGMFVFGVVGWLVGHVMCEREVCIYVCVCVCAAFCMASGNEMSCFVRWPFEFGDVCFFLFYIAGVDCVAASRQTL